MTFRECAADRQSAAPRLTVVAAAPAAAREGRAVAASGRPEGGGASVDGAALYRALLDAHPEPTFSLDASGAVLACNRAFARFLGRPVDAILTKELQGFFLPAEREAAARAWKLVLAGRAQAWRAEFEGPDGTVSIGHVTLAPVVLDGVVVGAQGIARDVTVYQVMEEQLHARVFTDPLTGLASRAQLHEAIQRSCRRATVPTSVAALFIDLDDFKLVNDALGHAAGDRLLSEVAERLRRATRGGDLVGRLGGDEFAVLLDGLAAPEDATIVVGRIVAALAAPIEIAGRPMSVTASLGVAHWDGSATASELLRNADLAMYRAKAQGKSRHAVFDVAMQSAARERLELASDLREALRRGEVEAYFQPIVDVATGRLVKAEALARWRHAERGWVSPGVFVPLAEEMGLVDELGALMLRHGCRQLRALQLAAGDGPAVGVTVNVSGRQVERGTIGQAVRAAVAESGADPRGLTLELTESVAMRQPERVLPVLGELAGLGVQLAIDDFGTGYSSLSYLHRFPVQVLKIDRSFVDGLGAEPADGHSETLVRTIITVAESLGLRTVAEGVETEAQRLALLALGCPMAQGYLFGRPAPGDQLLAAALA